MSYRIDCLQYANWSEKIFRQMREGGVDAVHVTVAYHETFRETVLNLEAWNRWFELYPDLIVKGQLASDIDVAKDKGKTAVFFGFQNPSPIEDDIGLVEILHTLGARFMQLSYNNQSLLATGCYEAEDPGLTRMGRQVIREMNRVGLVIDMSHSADRSTIEAADLSQRPITITHANPHCWQPALRNKRDEVIRAVTQNGGIMGFSLYPHHLMNKSDCTLESFCDMIADTVAKFGVEHFGIGSDLCQDQPDSIVEWMRVGRWSKDIDYGEGSANAPGFPAMPDWFRDNRDFGNIETGLRAKGFSDAEIAGLLGDNWYRFFQSNFTPQTA
ncbi:membrane dipeptidase [Boseongicola aestuarii]|uniref:Membrane dipeptidase (Peptidase family M19) n=1 Tax=Boseongicola aestuarii TaxID=1470561 RepID=A0A238IZR7_9RHOB|nr:membrane dipeptidase [Boseongicola aestuarii]SMX23886.1 Membrane dipeptidase (Peptidase family M19) [Boseongicola aestuarii]